MVRITEELVRKRAEHNEGEIGTLEEIALHQEDIEQIENLQHWCRDLKILLLHANLIAVIENVSKLKKLEYLNLSLNNIEIIENLEGCESLQKLDLTLNFIGEITSVHSLKHNEHLRSLFLTGNPCSDFKGYRDYVIAALPQLTSLDGTDILRSERIKAMQMYPKLDREISAEQKQYLCRRWLEKESKKGCIVTDLVDDGRSEEERMKEYWSGPSDNTPESRIEIAAAIRKTKQLKEGKPDPVQPKRTYRYFNNDGHPMNVNEAKIDFELQDDVENNRFVLEVAVYKYLDTSYIDVDVQPTYCKVMVKKKGLQVVLAEEVKPDSTVARRSETTGHLVITMPKAKGVIEAKVKPRCEKMKVTAKSTSNHKRELLEIGPAANSMDFSRITAVHSVLKTKTVNGDDFVDDLEVPPLE